MWCYFILCYFISFQIVIQWFLGMSISEFSRKDTWGFSKLKEVLRSHCVCYLSPLVKTLQLVLLFRMHSRQLISWFMPNHTLSHSWLRWWKSNIRASRLIKRLNIDVLLNNKAQKEGLKLLNCSEGILWKVFFCSHSLCPLVLPESLSFCCQRHPVDYLFVSPFSSSFAKSGVIVRSALVWKPTIP